MSRSVAVFAGEKSGDLYGSFLIQHLQAAEQVSVSGMGGSYMKNAGCTVIWDIADYAVMGFSEVIAHLPKFFRLFSQIKKYLAEHRPDFVVCIDNWGLNKKIAAYSKSIGLKVFYFICPKFWAWGPDRAQKVCAVSDQVYVIFPFEEEELKKYSDTVFFFGHPLVDVMNDSPLIPAEQIRRQYLEDRQYLVTVMPGSRASEIKMLAMPLAKICKYMSEICSIRFLVIQSDIVENHPGFKEFESIDGCSLVSDTDRYSIMSASDFVIAASGTVTLETMILQIPMAVFYKISTISYYIARLLLKIKNVSLPNIIAGKRIVPEKIQYFHESDTAQNICEILSDSKKSERMRKTLNKYAHKLGEPGVIEKIAVHMLGDA